MSNPTSVFSYRMFQGAPKGDIPGWEKVPPIPNKKSVERTPEQPPNPNGPRITSPIVRGPLFGISNSPTPRTPTPRTPTPRTPRRNQTPRHKTPLRPRKRNPTKRCFAPPSKTPRSTRRRR